MKILDLQQGSPEWLAIRGKYRTASEAPIMMGASKKVSRSDMVRMKATGDEQEYSSWVKNVLFEKGHEVEAEARPIANNIVGEPLYPITAIADDDYLLASFDGCIMDETITWECKQWNEEKAQYVRDYGLIPDDDYWQVVQQLVVSNAKKALYMITDGTEKKCVCCWKSLTKNDAAELYAGWKQFDIDVENYQHVETKHQPIGEAPKALPALHVRVMGMVTESNLEEFREQALLVINSINTDLNTDEDFANAAKTIKWCKEVESKLDALKDHILSQTSSIEETFRVINDISETTKTKRLNLNNLVETRKKNRRSEILQSGKDRWNEHVENLNKQFGGKIKLPHIAVDFAAVMKGKSLFKKLEEAVDVELARAKTEADQIADRILSNLNILRENEQYKMLFPDAQQLVTTKEGEDLRNLVKARIAEHKEKLERDAKEAQAKVEREAAEKAEQEAAAKAAEEERKTQAEAAAFVAEKNTSAQAAPTVETPVATTTEPVEQPKPRRYASPPTARRPSDRDIITVLIAHYKQPENVIVSWLREMNLEDADRKTA